MNHDESSLGFRVTINKGTVVAREDGQTLNNRHGQTMEDKAMAENIIFRSGNEYCIIKNFQDHPSTYLLTRLHLYFVKVIGSCGAHLAIASAAKK
jgi:hypothetical protein